MTRPTRLLLPGLLLVLLGARTATGRPEAPDLPPLTMPAFRVPDPAAREAIGEPTRAAVLTPEKRDAIMKRLRPEGRNAPGAVVVGGDDEVLDPDHQIWDLYMDIASDGDIYAALDVSESGGTPDDHWILVLRSTDGGDSFSEFGTIGGPAGGDTHLLHDLEVAEGTHDYLYVVYSVGPSPGYQSDQEIHVDRSPLTGASAAWTDAAVFNDPSIVYTSGDLTTDEVTFSDYYLYLAVAGNDGDGRDIWFTRSLDDGATWDPPYKIADLTSAYPSQDAHLLPKLSYGFGGAIHAAWTYREYNTSTGYYYFTSLYRRATNYGSGGIADWSSTATLLGPDYLADVVYGVAASATDSAVVVAVQGTNGPVARTSLDLGSSWPDTVALGLDQLWDLELRSDTGEFVAAGKCSTSSPDPGNHYDRVVITAPTTAPTAWSAGKIFNDAPELESYPLADRVAFDPTRGNRIALAWLPNTVAGIPPRFDAEWRSDPGYPVTEFTTHLPDVGIPTSPLVASVDDDPYLEIVFSDGDGMLHLLDHDGTEVGGWPHYVGTPPPGGEAAAGDLGGNGEMVIAIGDDGGNVYAFSGRTNQELPGFPTNLGNSGDAYISIGAVGGPYPRNIVAADGSGLHVLDSWGDIQQTWTLPDPQVGPAAIGDLDNDGTTEIVAAGEYGVQVVRLGDPAVTPLGDLGGHRINDQVTLADLDRNGDLEVIVPTVEGQVYVFNHDGTPFGAWPYLNSAGGAAYQVAAAHVAAGFDPDLAVTQHNGQITLLFDGAPSPGGIYPLTVGTIDTAPILADIHPGTAGTFVGTEESGKAWAYGNLGASLSGWPKALPGPCRTTPASGDLNLDGSNELVVVTDTMLVAYNLHYPPETNPEYHWPMKGYDSARTGCLDCPENLPDPTGVADDGKRPGWAWMAPPFPNPAGPAGTVFAYQIPDRAAVRLDIFDVQGRRVRTVLEEEEGPGNRSVRFDGRDEGGRPVPASLYFARLTVRGPRGKRTALRKFQIVR